MDATTMTTKRDCEFQIDIKSIKNRWIDGNYVVTVKANLPFYYTDITRVRTCRYTFFLFKECFDKIEKVSRDSTSAEWILPREYKDDENPYSRKLSFTFTESTSGWKKTIFVTVPKAQYPTTDFTSPLKGTPKISQEFGETNFSFNHTGIDFLIKHQNVYSIGDGRIDYIGWDNFSSKCDNGGRILRIKHSNGFYSSYFHLDSFGDLEKGDSVRRGQKIGVSGNSGAQKCKPLGYHLHFEIRTGQSQNLVIDPKHIIDI
ncbi:M23 family metallopeptidase [bacterium]|nr:M23 family metallopeptidase [bacterium]